MEKILLKSADDFTKELDKVRMFKFNHDLPYTPKSVPSEYPCMMLYTVDELEEYTESRYCMDYVFVYKKDFEI